MPVLQVTTTELTPTSSTSTYYATLIKIIEKEGSVLNSRYGCIYPLEPYKDVNDIIYDAISLPINGAHIFANFHQTYNKPLFLAVNMYASPLFTILILIFHSMKS